MLGALVRTTTGDGASLQGMHFEGGTHEHNWLVMHLHGSLGNFYENPFVDYFADGYTRQGVSFLSVNTRDHGVGGVTARFADCMSDIEAWLKFAWSRGYEKVLLQGHSLGALKAVHFLSSAFVDKPKVDGLILLSPFDIIAFYCNNDIAARASRLDTARTAAQANPDTVMPPAFFEYWPISAGTFLDLVSEGTVADVFPFRKNSLDNTALSHIGFPIFAAIGGSDFASFPSPTACLAQLGSVSGVSAVLIPDAPHNFAGHEVQLYNHVSHWMADTFGFTRE